MWRVITVVSIALSVTLARSLPEPGFTPPPVVQNYTCTAEGAFYYPQDCSKWIQCKRESGSKEIIPFEKLCPKLTSFSMVKRLCVKQVENERSDCEHYYIPKVHKKVEVAPTTCEKKGFIADPTDCQRYYFCNTKVFATGFHLRGPLRCPIETPVWDLQRKQCVHPGETTREDCRVSFPTTVVTLATNEPTKAPTLAASSTETITTTTTTVMPAELPTKAPTSMETPPTATTNVKLPEISPGTPSSTVSTVNKSTSNIPIESEPEKLSTESPSFTPTPSTEGTVRTSTPTDIITELPTEDPTTAGAKYSDGITTSRKSVDMPIYSSTSTAAPRTTGTIEVMIGDQPATEVSKESPISTKKEDFDEITTTEGTVLAPIDPPTSTVAPMTDKTIESSTPENPTTETPTESPITTEKAEFDEITTTEEAVVAPTDPPTSTVAPMTEKTIESSTPENPTTETPTESPTTTEEAEFDGITTTEGTVVAPTDPPTSTVAPMTGKTIESSTPENPTTETPTESPITTEKAEFDEITTTEEAVVAPTDPPTSTVAPMTEKTIESSTPENPTTETPTESPTTTEETEFDGITTTEGTVLAPIDPRTSTVVPMTEKTIESSTPENPTTETPTDSPTTTEEAEFDEISTTEEAVVAPTDPPTSTVAPMTEKTIESSTPENPTTETPTESPTTTEEAEFDRITTTEETVLAPIDPPTSIVVPMTEKTIENSTPENPTTETPTESPTTTEEAEFDEITTTEGTVLAPIDPPTSTVVTMTEKTIESATPENPTTETPTESPTTTEETEFDEITTTEGTVLAPIDPPTSTIAPMTSEIVEITTKEEPTTELPIGTPTTTKDLTIYETMTTKRPKDSSIEPPTSVTDLVTKTESIHCVRSGFIADPADCHKYYVCNKKSRGFNIRGPLECSNNFVYDSEKRECIIPEDTTRKECRIVFPTNQSTLHHDDRANVTYALPHATCPVGKLLGEQISLVCPTGFRRHPKYCNLFYQCTASDDSLSYNVNILKCPRNLVYDMNKIQCLPADEVTDPCTPKEETFPATGTIGMRPTQEFSVIPVTEKVLCPSIGHHPHDIKSCSSVFYKCLSKGSSLEGYVHKCPEGQAYWPVSRQCVDAKFLPLCAA